MGLAETFDLKLHGSGDSFSAFELDQFSVAVGAVAVADVVGHRAAEGVPVGVVGVFDDDSEIAQKWHSIRLR